MKNKILSFGVLLITWVMVMAPPSYAQSDTQGLKTNSTTVSAQSQQLPAAYSKSSWTVVGERIDGEGATTISGVDSRTFIIPNTATTSAPEATQATVVYDNGPHINQSGNPDLSIVETVTLGMSTLGGNVSNSAGFSLADDFELVAETEITGITVYAYQTGATSTTINAMYVTIWDGDPSGGGSVVWGDQTTNVFDSVEDINAYRVSETDQGGRTRMLQKVNASISGLTLDAGTYWLEYSLGGTATSGPWQPPIVILGETTTGDALHRTSTGWEPWVDTGTTTPQGLPFQIEGVEGGGGGAYCIPEGTNSSRYIDNFATTGGSENISNMGSGFSPDGYGDFYDTHTVAQEQGESIDFEVDIAGGISGFRVWVDWNQDGVFDTTEEVAYASSSYGNSQSGTITVPVDALEGDTRMRIVSHWLSTSGDVDPCETGFTYGEFEDYKFTVVAGGGAPGADCSLATVGVFENGKSFTKSLDRIVAHDITVPADQNLMLEKINLNAFIGSLGAGVNAADVDVYVYEDNGSGVPGPIHTMLPSVVPSSQTEIGDAFGFQAWDVEIDFAPVELTGQEGAETTYWIGVSLEATDGSNTFWEFYSDATAPVVGYGLAYNDGSGFVIEANNEGVYTFHATCSDIGGGGGGYSDCISTIYDGGNNGSPGGAVYFDITVGPEDIELTSIDLNTDVAGTGFSVDVYTIEGTHVGNETNQGAWTMRTSGSGTSAGEGSPSTATLDDTFVLSANTTYGMALVLDGTHSHHYTNGNGSNEHFENADLALDLGAATNTPFSGGVFSPRVFNGGLCYNVGGGGGGGVDCDQGDDSNGFENGYNITAGGTFRNADDFFVSANNTLNVRSIVLNVFADNPVDSININFFEDDGGMPGATVVESVSGVVPYAQPAIGGAFGYTVYAVHVEVDLDFVGGASGTSYWMQPEAVANVAFWEVTSVGSLGELIHTSEAMGPWTPDEDGVNHGVFKLHCEVVAAPDPQCLFDITSSVEPITRVVLADIDNTSSAVVNGSPALEDFTSIEGSMSQGVTYDIALEGNTAGDWTNYFTVWIDWDQNGEWEADEMYEIERMGRREWRQWAGPPTAAVWAETCSTSGTADFVFTGRRKRIIVGIR